MILPTPETCSPASDVNADVIETLSLPREAFGPPVGVERSWTRTTKEFGKRCVAAFGCGLNAIVGQRSTATVGILMYHRVAHPVPGLDKPTYNVSPAAFRSQMQGLLRRGFTPVALRQLIDGRCELKPGSKYFVVTFDDGHESVHKYAWPVLKELRIPATIFLATAYLDSDLPMPFDDWSAAGSKLVPAESWRALTTSQCREMAADGLIELGAHTHTHQNFCGRLGEFARDIAANAETLRTRFGVQNPAFAFPFGFCTNEMMNVIREEGLTCGLTTVAMPADPQSTPFGWGRFDVERWDTVRTLAAKLQGWYSWAPQVFRKLRRRPRLDGVLQ